MTPGAEKREEAIAARKIAYARIAVAVSSPFIVVYADEFYESSTATPGLRDGNL